MNVLERILAHKREEVATLRAGDGEVRLTAQAAQAPPPRGFAQALREGPPPRVIAEFKRASPSLGEIRPGADASAIASGYEKAGAAALSVLTDQRFFGGSLDDLRAARAACSVPVLRKDFVIDPVQLVEARAAGADAALLIVAALDDEALAALLRTARSLGLDALVEVHDLAELERAQEAGATLLGINNRDLRTFATDLSVTRALAPRAAGCTVVSESGIADAGVVHELAQAGAHAFLVGEALMAADDPAAALRALRGET